MSKQTKKYIILSVLFFLPVVFLLMLYPSTNNYNTLDIVKENVLDITNLSSLESKDIQLKNHITVLGFLGDNPEAKIVETSNLKELIYNKFKGFKKFQFVMLVTKGSQEKAKRLKQELTKYSELKYWHFVYVNQSDINKLFNSLRTSLQLDNTYATQSIFVIDKELNQRGRLDDRTKKEIEKKEKIKPLTAYNASQVAIIKNKLAGEDLRILFEEYRQKRKGNFDSSTRRVNDLKANKQ